MYAMDEEAYLELINNRNEIRRELETCTDAERRKFLVAWEADLTWQINN
jgi:hypothetical protein